jgi:hypothetical protein
MLKKSILAATLLAAAVSGAHAVTVVGDATLSDTAVVNPGTVTPTAYLTYLSGSNFTTGTADGTSYTIGAFTPGAAMATADHIWAQYDPAIFMTSGRTPLTSVLAIPAIDHGWTSDNTGEFWEPFEFKIWGCTAAVLSSCTEGHITAVYTRGVDDTGTGKNADDWATVWTFDTAYTIFAITSGDGSSAGRSRRRRRDRRARGRRRGSRAVGADADARRARRGRATSRGAGAGRAEPGRPGPTARDPRRPAARATLRRRSGSPGVRSCRPGSASPGRAPRFGGERGPRRRQDRARRRRRRRRGGLLGTRFGGGDPGAVGHHALRLDRSDGDEGGRQRCDQGDVAKEVRRCYHGVLAAGDSTRRTVEKASSRRERVATNAALEGMSRMQAA